MNTHSTTAVPVTAGTVVAAARDQARTESAVSASTYTVPSRFLMLLDVLVLTLALLAAWRVSPSIQEWLAADNAGRLPALSWLALTTTSDLAAGLRPLREILWIPLVMAPVTLIVVGLLGGYRPLLSQSRTRLLVSCAGGPVVGLSVVTLVVVTLRYQHTSRALLFAFTLLSIAGLFVHRYALRLYKYRRLLAGHYARNVVVVAPDTSRAWLMQHFAGHVPTTMYRLVGYLLLPAMNRNAGDSGGSHGTNDRTGEPDLVPCLGPVDRLGDLLIHRPIHEVVAVQSDAAGTWLKQVIEQCEYFRVTLRLVPEALLCWESRDLQIRFREGALRLPEIVLRPRHLDEDALFIKRLFDIVASAALLLLLSPLFLIIAVAIKLTTPHLPVFYPWRVIGYKGRPFTGYKFTTMQRDADDRKAELMHLNEMTGPVFKIREDPRVTPLGKHLRKYSLNELPQLWSVLKGDMSLVGPRPAYPNELARYELWHKRKLCVQPGITCLWQIRGRNEIRDFDDWVRMDFEYIDNWSLWLDWLILIRTIRAVILGTGS